MLKNSISLRLDTSGCLFIQTFFHFPKWTCEVVTNGSCIDHAAPYFSTKMGGLWRERGLTNGVESFLHASNVLDE